MMFLPITLLLDSNNWAYIRIHRCMYIIESYNFITVFTSFSLQCCKIFEMYSSWWWLHTYTCTLHKHSHYGYLVALPRRISCKVCCKLAILETWKCSVQIIKELSVWSFLPTTLFIASHDLQLWCTTASLGILWSDHKILFFWVPWLQSGTMQRIVTCFYKVWSFKQFVSRRIQ